MKRLLYIAWGVLVAAPLVFAGAFLVKLGFLSMGERWPAVMIRQEDYHTEDVW